MKTIEKRAKEYADKQVNIGTQALCRVEGYIAGATDQKAIDIEKAKEWIMNQFPDTYTYDDIPIEDAFVKFMEEEK